MESQSSTEALDSKEPLLKHRSTFGVPKIDLSGKTFGRLFVRFQDDPVKRRHGKETRWEIFWNCTCSCGAENVLVSGAHLKSSAIRSCGCLQKESTRSLFKKHGMCRTPEYNAYINAMKRCNDKKCKSFKNYGGRGIRFLFTSFDLFFKELGFRPEGKTLERKDNNGHYEPGNVCWATPREQTANRRIKRIEQFSTAVLREELKRRDKTGVSN